MFDREWQNSILRLMKMVAFALALVILGGAGLVWPRPDRSMVEKRMLTSFPAFSLASLWDGSFFSGVDTWYADTYPMREDLIAAQQEMEERYGLRGTQMIGGTVADAIPTGDEADAGGDAADAGAAPAATPEPTATPLPDGTVHEIGEFVPGGIYITGGSAYGGYYFSQNGADAYIDTMNQIYANIGDKVTMYVMDVPISASVMLDESVWADMGCSDERAAIEYVAGKLDPGIKPIMVYDTLREHNAEYIYFRTDHHWTALGAYYAYRVFCGMKGWTPHELDQFEMKTFAPDRYLGSYYTSSNKSSQLTSHPDTVYAWVPMATNDMQTTMRDGITYDWPIINDWFEYDDNNTYCIFAAADQPFSHIHNDTITDGSCIMVVKDSYGNSFIPWLVDHYEDIYWVDYRYTSNTVSELVEKYGVQEVIFEAATSLATGGSCNGYFASVGV